MGVILTCMEILRVETKINPARRGGKSKSVGSSFKRCFQCDKKASDRFKIILKNEAGKTKSLIMCATHSAQCYWGGKVLSTKKHKLLICYLCKERAAGGVWFGFTKEKPYFGDRIGNGWILQDNINTKLNAYCSGCFFKYIAKVDESIFED